MHCELKLSYGGGEYAFKTSDTERAALKHDAVFAKEALTFEVRAERERERRERATETDGQDGANKQAQQVESK